MTQRGWWRRNRWGLILLLPFLVGLFAPNFSAAYDRNYRNQPKEPVPVDGTGRAVVDDYAVRLATLRPVDNDLEIDDLIGSTGSPLPSTARIWRLMLAVEGPKETFVAQCTVWLQDAAGDLYRMHPSELRGGPVGLFACAPDDEQQPMPYLASSYFVLPADVRPTAVIITWPDRLPRHVRFPVAP